MVNSNSIGLNIDLATEQGKAIFAALAAVVLGNSFTASEVLTPKAVKEAKVVKMPDAVVTAPAALPTLPQAPSAPAAVVTAPPVIKAPSLPQAPSAPAAVAAPVLPPAAPSLPQAPAAPVAAKEPKAPKVAAPVVDFASLDADGKREAIKKITTKHSKKGKTTDMKMLFSAYGATNVESIPADYLDHFNQSITSYDGGATAADILATFGAQ
jgi:hypothetical protein